MKATNIPDSRSCLEKYFSVYSKVSASRINVGRPLLPCSITSRSVKPVDLILEPMSILLHEVKLFSANVIEQFSKEIHIQCRRWTIYGLPVCYLAFLVEMVKESGHEDPGEIHTLYSFKIQALSSKNMRAIGWLALESSSGFRVSTICPSTSRKTTSAIL